MDIIGFDGFEVKQANLAAMLKSIEPQLTGGVDRNRIFS